MFEKDSTLIRYIRENYTMAEKIYEGYMIMRKAVGDIENIKYDNPDKSVRLMRYNESSDDEDENKWMFSISKNHNKICFFMKSVNSL